MERKIGEIFEYHGEWYQCVKSPDGSCKHCDMNFGGKCPIPIKECVASSRSDLSYVIFKKLEKVGEPYEFDGHLFQSYRTFEVPIFTENYATVREFGNNSKISIEIKQTKEDMEDLDKIKVRDYTKVEELNVMEEKKLNLKPFDIQKAKDGKPVCTRDGRKARIICFDRKGYNMFPIVALIMNGDRESDIYTYRPNGTWDNSGNESDKDLMMLPEKKEGWVNVYRDCDGANITKDDNIYSSKDAAIASAQIIDRDNYVATTIIKWEE